MKLAMFGSVLLAACGVAAAGVPAGVDGNWYNPQQSGHGITVEIVDTDRAVVLWFAYTPTGEQLYLYLDGVIDGRSIISTAYETGGMRFGEFDPATNTLQRWGEVTIEFSDCSHATLSYVADDIAYGSGGVPLQRLATAPPEACQLDAPSSLPAGGYTGPWERGLVDSTGTLYALQTFALYPMVFVGEPVHRAAGAVTLEISTKPVTWFCDIVACGTPQAGAPERVDFVIRDDDAAATWWRARVPGGQRFPEPILSRVLGGGTLGMHPGTYRVNLHPNQTPDTRTFELQIGCTGALCVRTDGGDCAYEGQLAGDGRFELVRSGDPQAQPFSGAALFRSIAVGFGRSATFIGSDGASGLAFFAERTMAASCPSG